MSDEVRSARAGLSSWLTAGREARGWTREHVARVTRIPMRTLENLEDGRWSELPADVFVRGFLRSYARCVGLSIDDALAQYAGCGFAAAPVASAQAHALLDSMAPLTAPTYVPRAATSTPITSQPRILGTGHAAEPTASASGSMRVEAASASGSMQIAEASASGSMRAAEAASASGSMQIAEASASGSMRAADEALAQAIDTIAMPDAPGGSTSSPTMGRRRHKRPPTVVNAAGSRERDARGRFIRKSVEMAAVADPTLEAAAEPVVDAGPGPSEAAPRRETLAQGSVSRRRIPAPPAVVAARSDRSPIEATPTEGIGAAWMSTDGIPSDGPETAADAAIAIPRGDDAAAPVTVVPPAGVARFLPAPRRSAPMAAPSLVIDDDDPDDADRAREQRAQAHKDGGWRSFLPPALLDQERGGRQGGLTLAVIILLIVATLTLSYLMRRPSSTGEGVTVSPPSERGASEPGAPVPATDRLG